MCRQAEEAEGCPSPAPPGNRGRSGGGGGRGGHVQPGEPLSGESHKQTHTFLLHLLCYVPLQSSQLSAQI